jgi:hypothetical protein
MNLFIAVAFFCLENQCYFWKAKDNYFTFEECAVALKAYMNSKEDEIEIVGNCLKIDLQNNA